MTIHRRFPSCAAAVLVAVVVVALGGRAVASNMAFRFRMPIVQATGPRFVGNNLISLPFNNPYVNGAGICSAWRLSSTGVSRAILTTLDAVTGSYRTGTCGTPGATSMTLVPGRCIMIHEPSAAVTSVLIVGSHDPSLAITLPAAGTGQVGTYWYSVPYHATAYTVNDLCLQTGMSSTGPLRASCTKLDAPTGSYSQVTCGTPAGSSAGAVIQLGQCWMCREPNGPLTFTPQTYWEIRREKHADPLHRGRLRPGPIRHRPGAVFRRVRRGRLPIAAIHRTDGPLSAAPGGLHRGTRDLHESNDVQLAGGRLGLRAAGLRRGDR